MCHKGTTRRQAEAMLREIEAGVRSGLAPRRSRKATTTVAELCAEWLAGGEGRWTPQTTETRGRFVQKYILPTLGASRADDVEKVQLEAWLEALPIKDSTRGTVRAMVRAAWRWGLERGLVTRDPTVGLKAPKASATIPRYLSWDEYQAALAGAPPDVRDGLVLSVRTGVRAGELLGLYWRDVHEDALVVERSLDRVTGRMKVPKGRRPRRIPLHPDARAVLARRRQEATEARVLPMTYEQWKQACRTALKRAGVNGGPHLLRHTCASWWVQQGGSLMALQRILGHSSIRMTLIYAHLAPDSVEQEAPRVWWHMVPRTDGQQGDKPEVADVSEPSDTAAI